MDFNPSIMKSNSFIEDQPSYYCSDILSKVKMITGIVSLHRYRALEEPLEKLMAFRFLRYAIAVMQRQQEQDNNNFSVVVIPMFFKVKPRCILIGIIY